MDLLTLSVLEDTKGSGSGRCVSQSRVLGDAEAPGRGARTVFPRGFTIVARVGVEGQTMREREAE